MTFKKGNNFGSNSHRSKEIVEFIKEQTGGGKELIDTALTILRNPDTKTKDVISILVYLTDRGWGKPMQHQIVEGETKIVVSNPIRPGKDE